MSAWAPNASFQTSQGLILGLIGIDRPAPAESGARDQRAYAAAFGGVRRLALSAFAAHAHTREVLFGVGAATLLLLFVGIHNAWDAASYHVLVRRKPDDRGVDPAQPD